MTQATLVRQIAARPERVFDALVTAEAMVEWWACGDAAAVSVVSDPRVGGHYEVRFATPAGLEHVCSGEYLELARPERLVMSWRWLVNGVDEEHGRVSRVEFRLRAIDGQGMPLAGSAAEWQRGGLDLGTELTLFHSELCSDASARAHEGGWTGSLAKLLDQFAHA